MSPGPPTEPVDAADPWRRGPAGGHPWPLALSLVLAPVLALWTLPQTLAGLAYGLARGVRGARLGLYRFGPFLFLVVREAPVASSGISLGLVVFADRPALLTHEFCHLYTGLWLSWLYLPVYGLEYLLWGHDRSPHERITVHLEETTRYGWRSF